MNKKNFRLTKNHILTNVFSYFGKNHVAIDDNANDIRNSAQLNNFNIKDMNSFSNPGNTIKINVSNKNIDANEKNINNIIEEE